MGVASSSDRGVGIIPVGLRTNTTSRFRSIAPNLGAALFKRPELQLIIQIEHVGMKRMHSSNAKLNPKYPVVGWTARAFSGCAGHPPLRVQTEVCAKGPYHRLARRV